MTTIPTPQREAEARGRARYLTGLLWHIGAFVIVNGAFWLMDGLLGAEGFQWAYWITAVWGVALAFHALAWFVDGRAVEDRKTREYLSDD
jgi:MFS family permease